MPGTLWWNFRQGDRSEYLALYALSALGVAVTVPRQEDIGADFHCTLASSDGKRLTFRDPFLVQVKSASKKSKICYGGPDVRGRWKKEELDWLFGQELPLLIGLVDKASATLALHTTSNMWYGRYQGGNLGQVWLRPDVPSEEGAEIPRPSAATPESTWPSGIGDGQLWTVPLGPPVVSLRIEDLESAEKLNLFREILSWVVRMDQTNITYRRMGVHYSRWPLKVFPNKLEKIFYGVGCAGNTGEGMNTDAQLKAIAPFLATLALNFKLQQKPEEIENLKPIAQMIPQGSPEANELRKLISGLLETPASPKTEDAPADKPG